MKLINIYEALLTEFVSQNLNTIISSINDKKLINIYYDDDRTGLKGWRRVEPFCVGKNTYGNDCLRAWQQHGVSATYPPGKTDDPLTHVPGWRMFRIDKITNINVTGNDTFNSPRPKYNPQDKDMVEIYAAVDFGTNPGGYTTYNPAPTAPTAPVTPNAPVSTPTTTGNNPVIPTPQTTTQPVQPNSTSGYAHYNEKPGDNIQVNTDKKASKFDLWANKFKNLIGYKPK
jgi:hypothetical protein